MRSATVGMFGSAAGAGTVDTGALGRCVGGLVDAVAESDRYPELCSRLYRSCIGRVDEGACLALLDRPREVLRGCK